MMPGFTAEASFHAAGEQRRYALTCAWNSKGEVVVPQQTIDLTFPREFPHGRICRWKCYAEAGGIIWCYKECY